MLELVPTVAMEVHRESNWPRNDCFVWDQRDREEVADDRDTQPCPGPLSFGSPHLSPVCNAGSPDGPNYICTQCI